MKEKIRKIIHDQLAEWCMPQTTLLMKKEDKVKFAFDLADAIYEFIGTDNYVNKKYYGMKGIMDKNGICHLQNGISIDSKSMKDED